MSDGDLFPECELIKAIAGMKRSAVLDAEWGEMLEHIFPTELEEFHEGKKLVSALCKKVGCPWSVNPVA